MLGYVHTLGNPQQKSGVISKDFTAVLDTDYPLFSGANPNPDAESIGIPHKIYDLKPIFSNPRWKITTTQLTM